MKLHSGHTIVCCKRCCWRYETPAGASDFPCPHCSDAYVGIGAGFDEACVDAARRLRQLGPSRAWIVSLHRVYSRDVGDKNANDDRFVIHMVHLREEHAGAG